MPQPSPYWGSEVIWTSKNNVHNPMLDEQGPRVDHVGGAARRQPRLLQGGLDASVGEALPGRSASGRHLAMYDPKTKKLTHISTCFGTHHLMFAEDANNTLWTSGGGQVVGWLEHEDVRRDRRRGERRRAGRRSSSTPTATASATRTSSRTSRSIRRRTSATAAAFYAVAPAPDGSIWGSVARLPRRGRAPRARAANPPETALAEVYEPPFDNAEAAKRRASRRAAWTSIATASRGWRSRAVTWPASIGASARAR